MASCIWATRKVEKRQDIASEAKKVRAATVAWTIKSNRHDLIYSTRARRHDHDAVTHVDGFVNVMGDEEHGSASHLPKPEHFVLHPHAGKGVERAERLVEQKNFRVIDERSC